MIWPRTFMRTAFIFLVAMTMSANESDANIRAEWTQLTDGLPMDRVRVLETDGRILYAGASSGLYISPDDGYTWWRSPIEVKYGYETIAISRDAVYAGARTQGVFRSDDRGGRWKPVNNGFYVHHWEDGEISYLRVNDILITSSGTVIIAMSGAAYTSVDRGETWHDLSDEWRFGKVSISDDIEWITEFDGYLWAATWHRILRSPDNGQTWDDASAGNEEFSWPTDWVVLNGRLYMAAERHYFARNKFEEGFFARYEAPHHWEVLLQGLPPTNIETLAVNRGRIFAGLDRRGVWMFNERSERWIPAALDGLRVYSLVSHQSDLFAATDGGIYRASIPIVQPYGKTATTWGAVKRQ